MQPKKVATAERLLDFANMLRKHQAQANVEHQEPLFVFEFRHSSWFCQEVRREVGLPGAEPEGKGPWLSGHSVSLLFTRTEQADMQRASQLTRPPASSRRCTTSSRASHASCLRSCMSRQTSPGTAGSGSVRSTPHLLGVRISTARQSGHSRRRWRLHQYICAHPCLVPFSHLIPPAGDLGDGWWPRDNATVDRINEGKALYLRLHGTRGQYVGDYGETEMARVRAPCGSAHGTEPGRLV